MKPKKPEENREKKGKESFETGLVKLNLFIN
jgi:hypothetical protein